MSKNTADSSWQRFLGWLSGQRQAPGEAPKTEQIAAWEDEGGATVPPAAGNSAVPAPSGDLTR